MTVGAILLAAGSARRMGQDKLLADLGGKPMILHAVEAIAAAGLAGPIAAVAPGSTILALLQGRATLVDVPDHALGMGHSLAAAIPAVPPDWTAVVVCLGDMPFVRSDTLRGLAHRASEAAILRPMFEGRPGNPLLWGRRYFNELGSLSGDQGGRALLDRYSATPFDCDDPAILFDIDTPERLAEARARLPSQPSRT